MAKPLTVENVAKLIELNVYSVGFATSNTDKSKAYNVMQKVFQNGEVVKDFFCCLWCSTVMKLTPKGGTTPLIRHVENCKKRPENYILPDENEWRIPTNQIVEPSAEPNISTT